MSNLSSINPSLERLTREITEIKRGKQGNHYRPHKMVLLLAIIELADRGLLTENKIYLSNILIQIFENIFILVKRKDDLCQPGPPFFHLRTSGFWFHKVRPAKQSKYDKLTTTGGGIRMIEEYIEYAYLRQDVYELLQNQEIRRELRLFISQLINKE